MNLTEAFTLRAAIPEPVDYGGTPWGPRIFVGAGAGRVEGDRLRADIVPNRGGDWLLRLARVTAAAASITSTCGHDSTRGGQAKARMPPRPQD